MRNSILKLFQNSSLIPLSKIVNAPTRPIRILWIVFSCTMLIGLLSCVTHAIFQYFQHQTVFQLDYTSMQSAHDQLPSFTVCFQEDNALRMFRQSMRRWLNASAWRRATRESSVTKQKPWLLRSSKPYFDTVFAVRTPSAPTRSETADVWRQQKEQRNEQVQLEWSTRQAESPLYIALHNFTVAFSILPNTTDNTRYSLRVREQIPHKHSYLCTTFEIISNTDYHNWYHVRMTVENEMDTYEDGDDDGDNDEADADSNKYGAQAGSPSRPAAPPSRHPHRGYSMEIILHEIGEMPFSAYDRHIFERIAAGNQTRIYFSKAVTKRINSKRNPCRMSSTADADTQNRLFGRESYNYSHEACGWELCCRKLRRICRCNCDLQVFNYSQRPCPDACNSNKHCAMQIDTKKCPITCISTKYIKHNSNIIRKIAKHQNQLILIKSENTHIATEEDIYSLTKLWSEIGGLSSLFIGFSFIFMFELIEAMIIYQDTRSRWGIFSRISKRNASDDSHNKIQTNCHAQQIILKEDAQQQNRLLYSHVSSPANSNSVNARRGNTCEFNILQNEHAGHQKQLVEPQNNLLQTPEIIRFPSPLPSSPASAFSEPHQTVTTTANLDLMKQIQLILELKKQQQVNDNDNAAPHERRVDASEKIFFKMFGFSEISSENLVDLICDSETEINFKIIKNCDPQIF